ncbi:MAG: histidine kinase [Bacteroidales bacterium]
MAVRSTIWRYLWIVALVSLALGILIHFEKITDILFPDLLPGPGGRRPSHSPGETAGDVAISSLVAFLTFLLNYFILRPFDPDARLNWKRMALSIGLTLVIIVLLSDLFFATKHLLQSPLHPRHGIRRYLFRDVFIAGVVVAVVYVIRLVRERQAIRIEYEKLKNESLLSQFEALKKQVSPHFFFNSLTSLKELIVQDPEKAADYVAHLSKVMRSTLQQNEQRLLTLKEERALTDSYLFLLKIRFGESLRVEVRIDTSLEHLYLPALALQTLVENAIKHNEVSRRRPLSIHIETTALPSVRVRNNLQEKKHPEQSTGLGLGNLSRQYLILSGRDIAITRTEAEMCVDLPLIKQPLS